MRHEAPHNRVEVKTHCAATDQCDQTRKGQRQAQGVLGSKPVAASVYNQVELELAGVEHALRRLDEGHLRRLRSLRGGYRRHDAEEEPTAKLCHGFLNWSRSPAVHAFAQRLAQEVNVVLPDLRGHGRPGGRCSMGRSEPPDVAGAMSISGPAWWGTPDRSGARRLARWVTTPLGRAVLAGALGTCVDTCAAGAQGSRRVVSVIAPAFVLVVHDTDDDYFGPEHPLQVMDRALELTELWWIPGAGHGNDLLTPALADRLPAAVRAKAAAAPGARAPGMGGGLAYVAAGTGAFAARPPSLRDAAAAGHAGPSVR